MILHLSKLVIWGSSWGRGFRFHWLRGLGGQAHEIVGACTSAAAGRESRPSRAHGGTGAAAAAAAAAYQVAPLGPTLSLLRKAAEHL